MDKNVVIARAVGYHIIHTGFALAITLLGLISCLALFHSHKSYRSLVRLIGHTYGSCLVLLNWLFADNKLVITGDHTWLHTPAADKVLFISNHQVYPDWWYLWAFAWYKGRGGDLKIIMLEWLKNVPIFGTAMWLFEFLFVTGKWARDKRVFTRDLELAKKDGLPIWLLIFPEGTLNTPHNVEKSKAFAAKSGISQHPKHMLLPKSTGSFHCIGHLLPNACTHIVDVTVAYEGLTADQIPYYVYMMGKTFHEGACPPRVHMHVRTFPMESIPGLADADGKLTTFDSDSVSNDRKDAFTKWLQDRYFEKDEMLARFFQTGSLVEDVTASTSTDEKNSSLNTEIVRLEPGFNDWLIILFMFTSLFYTVPIFWWIAKTGLWLVYRIFFGGLFSSGGIFGTWKAAGEL